MKRVIIFILLAAVCLSTCAAAAEGDAVFAFDSSLYTVNAGKSIQLQPVLQNMQKPAGAKYVWESSDPQVAAVSGNGSVRGKAVGEATVTCTLTAKDVTLTAVTTVRVVQPVQKLTSEEKSIRIHYTMTYDWAPKAEPENAYNKALRFSSSNEGIATVDENGRITPAGIGKCTVTAETTDGSGKKIKVPVQIAEVYVADEEIVLDERRTYSVRILTGGFGSYIKKWPKEIVGLGNISVMTRIGSTYVDGFGDVQLLINPVRAGKGTLIIADSTGRENYTVKLQVEHSACYDQVSFPKLDLAAALAAGDAAKGQQVSLTGTVLSVDRDADGRAAFTVSTGKGQDDRVLCVLPTAGAATRLIPGDKVSVWGALDGVREERTDTGLAKRTLVVTVEQAGDENYNPELKELQVTYETW